MELRQRALQALQTPDPQQKVDQASVIWSQFASFSIANSSIPEPPGLPGRPAQPPLIEPTRVPQRSPFTFEGRAALIHAICHIEFNAINLALDCVYRFRSQARAFHDDWIKVAAEEAYHFDLVCERLAALGFAYGDFPAHDGLWDMACRTAHDLLARMALVPRVLEARGLDATPPIMNKLRAAGDQASVAVLEIILRDEIGHVAIGDRWFRAQCAVRGLEPEATYVQLIDDFRAPRPQPPLHIEARLAAGFSAAELEHLSRPRQRRE